MIKCKICGHESKYRLIEHIQKIHKLDINFYKENYGKVVSDEYSERVSKKSKEKWQDKEYVEKTNKSKEWIYTDINLQQRRVESIKKYYSNGGKTWNDGLTKDNDDRLKSIGDKNKNNLTGRTKENYEYLKEKSDFMKSTWNDSKLLKKWKLIQDNIELKKDWKNKISETLTNKILNGKINTLNSFNNGWYESKNENHWFSSQLEKDSMLLFDKYNLQWTTKHKIKIEYFIDDERHYYIPDFLIKIKNIEYIIEMKGFDWDGFTDIKKEYAEKKINNYKLFYTINDLNNFLNEKINE